MKRFGYHFSARVRGKTTFNVKMTNGLRSIKAVRAARISQPWTGRRIFQSLSFQTSLFPPRCWRRRDNVAQTGHVREVRGQFGKVPVSAIERRVGIGTVEMNRLISRPLDKMHSRYNGQIPGGKVDRLTHVLYWWMDIDGFTDGWVEVTVDWQISE